MQSPYNLQSRPQTSASYKKYITIEQTKTEPRKAPLNPLPARIAEFSCVLFVSFLSSLCLCEWCFPHLKLLSCQYRSMIDTPVVSYLLGSLADSILDSSASSPVTLLGG